MTDWFEDLYRETHDAVLGYLTRRVPPSDAADLLAETYLIAWRRRDELPAAEGRRPWLFGVARRLLLAHQRRQPVVLPLDGDHACAEAAPGPDSTDRGAAVRRALVSLGPVDRELVTLTVWDGLSPAEAAAVVGLTAGTARVRLHRARARLARHPELRGLLGDPDPAPPRPHLAATAQPT